MRVTSALYRAARLGRDARSIQRTVLTSSPKPILKRIVNKIIGRVIVSRLWWR